MEETCKEGPKASITFETPDDNDIAEDATLKLTNDRRQRRRQRRHFEIEILSEADKQCVL